MATPSAAGDAANPYQAPTADPGLGPHQYILSPDQFSRVMLRSGNQRAVRRRLLLVAGGLIALAIVVYAFELSRGGSDIGLPALLAIFAASLLFAGLRRTNPIYRKIYDELGMAARVCEIRHQDAGVVLRRNRASSFIPSEEVAEVVVEGDLAFVIEGKWIIHGVALRTPEIRAAVDALAADVAAGPRQPG